MSKAESTQWSRPPEDPRLEAFGGDGDTPEDDCAACNWEAPVAGDIVLCPYHGWRAEIMCGQFPQATSAEILAILKWRVRADCAAYRRRTARERVWDHPL
jgi:hypothetical protein